MNACFRSVVVVIRFFSVILFSQFLLIQTVHAQKTFFNGTTLFVYGTSNPKDFTHQALINTYLPLSGFNSTQVVYHDISRMSGDQVRSLMVKDVASNPSTSYFMGSVGHGEARVGSAYLDNSRLDRTQMGDAINNAYAQNGTQGWMFEDSCGSGATCSFWNPSSNSSVQGVFTSTKPGVVGNDRNYLNRNDPNFNSGWQSDYGEAIKGMLNNAGKGGPNDADKNRDGVLSGREVGDYLNSHNPGQYKLKQGSADEPMFFKDKATAEKYRKEPPTPCQVSPHFYIQDYGLDKIEHTQDDIYEYAENIYDSKGGVKFAEGSIVTKNFNNASAISSPDGLFVDRGGHRVKVGPAKVGDSTPGADGKYYKVSGTHPGSAELYGDEAPKLPECDFSADDKGSAGAGNGAGSGFGNVAGGSGQGGGGAGGQGGGGLGGLGGGGGLNALLPLLMQGLLGGGGGGQGGYGNQNPYGSQYPPYNQQQQQNCASIAQSPVCGTDGQTYNNACYLRQAGVSIQKQGACTQPTPTPNIAAISQSVVNQLNASGIPAAILEQVRNAVTSVLGSVLSGGANFAETIIK